VPKHEQYEELCTLAMIGETSPAEIEDLRQHLSECPDCRREYQEFVQLVLPQLSASDESVPPASGATNDDTHGRRARFFERAQAAGISFSAKALNPPEELTDAPEAVPPAAPIEIPARKRAGLNLVYRGSIAAALLMAAALGGYLEANRHGQSAKSTAGNSSTPPAPAVANDTNNQTATAPNFSAVMVADARTIADLEGKLGTANAQLAAAQTNADSLATERSQLELEIQSQKQALAASQQQGQASEQTATSLQTKLSELQARADANTSNASLDQLKTKELSAQVAELTTSLDRERDMLSAGREMRDMMAARNLHIVDVVDTDSKGKNQPAFGRIFFAQNRQLVFYAYDLNEKRLEDARYDYRIWGQKEGQPHTARSLGIFYSDDKTQHRWVFKCEDPKTLSEIDSVFVTLEPATADPAHPKGAQLMYAYLRGQPNHP
jgi:regulator of replication initiation timing